MSKHIPSFALIKMLVEFILQMKIASLGLLYLVFQLPDIQGIGYFGTRFGLFQVSKVIRFIAVMVARTHAIRARFNSRVGRIQTFRALFTGYQNTASTFSRTVFYYKIPGVLIATFAHWGFRMPYRTNGNGNSRQTALFF